MQDKRQFMQPIPVKLPDSGEPKHPPGAGLNYGTVIGRGGGGARFYGQGNIFLNSAGGASTSPNPFAISVQRDPRGGGTRIKVRPGTINGMLPENWDDAARKGLIATPSSTSYVVLDLKSDGVILTSAKLLMDSNLSPQTPRLGLAPTEFRWPIAVVSPTTSYSLVNSSLTAVVMEASRRLVGGAAQEDFGYNIEYIWAVSSSLAPTFINIAGIVE